MNRHTEPGFLCLLAEDPEEAGLCQQLDNVPEGIAMRINGVSAEDSAAFFAIGAAIDEQVELGEDAWVLCSPNTHPRAWKLYQVDVRISATATEVEQ